DRGRFDDAAACFADDGVLDVDGHDRSEGRAAIADRFAAAGRKLASTSMQALVRHHVSSILVEVDDADGTATASSYFFVVTEVGPDHWGTYPDGLRLDPASGRWLFPLRQVRVDGRTGPSRMT